MIKDANGNELTYWPISGLIEGEDSEVLDFTVEIPGTGASLVVTEHDDLLIWVKKVGDPSFVNPPYDLTGLSGDVDFQMYVEALTTVEGFMRIPITVVAGLSSPAGWAV